MSIRTWPAEQSGEIDVLVGTGEQGPVFQTRPVATQEDLIKALVDLAVILDRCGGTAGIVLKRIPGPIPGSMVTEQAVIQWQERTDAKPQPEPSALQPQYEAGDMADRLREVTVATHQDLGEVEVLEPEAPADLADADALAAAANGSIEG